MVPDDRAPPATDGDDSAPGTTRALDGDVARVGAVRSFQLVVEQGPSTGLTWASAGDRCAIGSHQSNDLVIDDDTVSRFHCEIRIGAEGARLHDVGSRNGTTLDGVRVADGWLRADSTIRIGRTVLRFRFGAEVHELPVHDEPRFGSLVGVSLPMRRAFALLARAAATDVTVLLEGETGTGKEGAARAIHDNSARAGGKLVIVDCGAIPGNLLESELFGHERGAFTGAATRRVGAFEDASGGTIFLDEIGELPLELQPKLLRALEQHHIRRIGGNSYEDVDVRIVAATNRDLRAEVNDGRFRSDLYYRLAVVRVPLPSLRQRPEDIPLLIDRILTGLTDDRQVRASLQTPELVARLQHRAWPGNVRELRNYLERALVLGSAYADVEAPADSHAPPPRPRDADASLPYAEARQHALDQFERAYVRALLDAHGGKVAAAARAAGMNRAYLYRLVERHGVKS